jgi:hypothetical protein
LVFICSDIEWILPGPRTELLCASAADRIIRKAVVGLARNVILDQSGRSGKRSIDKIQLALW